MARGIGNNMGSNGATGGAYGLGFIGAVVYYLQHAVTFGAVVLGILKSIVWPAFLVYHLFLYLKI